jgi:pyruvate formate lyase activating enzyme
MNEALFYEQLSEKSVQCTLCPRECTIAEGRYGNCHVRRNRDGVLVSETYGKLSAMGLDPIEKKPLYHFFPGSGIFSVGSVGCNLHCVFCQNHTLSQCNTRKPPIIKVVTAEELVDIALGTEQNIGIAFTYNEPIVSYEFVIDTARLAQKAGLKTVMVSNGYINTGPLDGLIDCIDAFNIDLKGFTDRFYQKLTKATLEPVKSCLAKIARANRHLEITNLVIPTYNDDEEEFESMCQWIAEELGDGTVLHLSRYFPRYGLDQYPTPPEILFGLYDLAKTYLKHVYIGNLATELHSNTICPGCGKTMIKRTYYHINKKGMDASGCCTACNTKVIKFV